MNTFPKLTVGEVNIWFLENERFFVATDQKVCHHSVGEQQLCLKFFLIHFTAVNLKITKSLKRHSFPFRKMTEFLKLCSVIKLLHLNRNGFSSAQKILPIIHSSKYFQVGRWLFENGWNIYQSRELLSPNCKFFVDRYLNL